MELPRLLKEELVQRFMPILAIDSDEPSFPIEPRSFVESAALWSSGPPAHPRAQWGTAGVGERLPLIPRGGISLDPAHDVRGTADPDGDGVPEHYLGEHHGEHFPFLRPRGVELWLDTGGWQDGDKVTAGSANLRALRDSRAGLSQPWFSVDVWSPSDLRRELGPAIFEARFGLDTDDQAPALAGTVAITFGFLFPVHHQPRNGTAHPPGKDPWTADYEGDWSHFAVIGRLDDRSVQGFTPLFGAFGQRWRGTRRDFEDLERVRMELRPWSTLIVIDDHPLVVASPGTHNLHPHDPPLTPGGGIDLQWVDFGMSSGGQSAGAWVSDAVEQPASAVLALKILAGAALGGLAGGPLGALAGLAVGAIAASAEASLAEEEGLWKEPEFEESPAPDPPGDDPFSEDAVDLAKSSLAMPAGIPEPSFFDPAGGERRDWISTPDQALVDGSIILDRSADGRPPFYVGRWGVRCDADPLLLRSGIRLPNWRIAILDVLLKQGA